MSSQYFYQCMKCGHKMDRPAIYTICNRCDSANVLRFTKS